MESGKGSSFIQELRILITPCQFVRTVKLLLLCAYMLEHENDDGR